MQILVLASSVWKFRPRRVVTVGGPFHSAVCGENAGDFMKAVLGVNGRIEVQRHVYDATVPTSKVGVPRASEPRAGQSPSMNGWHAVEALSGAVCSRRGSECLALETISAVSD
jgi:hypothetical protein